MAVYDLPDDWWQTYRSHLEAVGPAEVLEAARELVRPDDALILVAGDASRLREEVDAAGFGPVETASL
jgi:hypothetical protein